MVADIAALAAGACSPVATITEDSTFTRGLVMALRRLLLAAVVANALLVGAAGDQVIKQLPARHRVGMEAFSAYSQAADLSNGVLWYATLGIGSALLGVMAAIVGIRTYRYRTPALVVPLAIALACTVAHSVVTVVAAPVNFSQRGARDVAELTVIFDRFEQLTVARAVLQAAVLAALLVALARLTSPAGDGHTPG